MIAAAHITDLQNAKKNGLSTAFIPRPNEFGDGEYTPDLEADQSVDIVASDFVELADKLSK